MKSKWFSRLDPRALTFGAMAVASAVTLAAVVGPDIYHAAVEHPWMFAGHVAAFVSSMIVAALWGLEHGLLVGTGCIMLLSSSHIAERIISVMAP